ncbi:MAG: acyl-CoA dehydrogenase family protein [Alphaproteobacteria bacterium]
MVSFELSEKQKELQLRARKFAQEEVAPWVTAADLEPEPSKGFSWDLVRKGSALGFRTLSMPKKYGGEEADILSLCLMMEEFGAVDAGIAGVFDQCLRLNYIITDTMSDEQRNRWLPKFTDDPDCLIAIGITEPEHGSDTFGLAYGPGIGLQLKAERDGDDWVLNGTKDFISNAGMAKIYFILARTDNTVGIDKGVTCFVVEKGHPGFRFGPYRDKLGKRTEVNCPLIFENCRIPDRDRVSPVGTGVKYIAHLAKGSHVETAAMTLGLARHAHELSLDWAKKRVQGGKPIIRHQSVQQMIGEQAMLVEATRNFIWRAALRADEEPFQPHFSMLCKVFAAESAFTCAKLGLEIMGGHGFMKHYPMERIFRDASAYFHTDGMNKLHLMKAAQIIGRVPPERM